MCLVAHISSISDYIFIRAKMFQTKTVKIIEMDIFIFNTLNA
jgi:hypothetical protein